MTTICLELGRGWHPAREQQRVAPLPGDMAAEVAAARHGDERAFEALYRLHVGRVHALARRLAFDPDRADELTQDVFVRAWERLGTFRGESTFAT